ncbi:glycosyl hydrolase 115 family protein [Desertivirga xinjiangensis]|uniref:glycosyl hydrolase 115 family protein n=1 Tax=Desertivirga xinjiangensis TaxID=539206 RepID=UPI00210AC823|nr:glycosyl hydrolase 115 family protein [Pedobacter xinjiangensis]
MKKLNCLFLGTLLLLFMQVKANDDISYVSNKPVSNGFALIADSKPVPVLCTNADHPGVLRAVKDFQNDLKLVSQSQPALLNSPEGKLLVLIGTIGKNKWIDVLIREKKLNVSAVKGKWEASITQIINKPFPGVEKALVIAGSDKRGTIYGIYDLSAQIGVSPWYYWADVPVKQQKEVYVLPMIHVRKEPVVKYRGIFINDEAPALSGWSREKFGGFNHKFYEKVFELILRLKGNYLWPAMWGSAFYDDDPQNPKLADEMGIVIGTSHHEPLMRAHDEWRRYGKGAWNYNSNAAALQEFWRGGIKRMGNNESIVSIGMRGDGDEPMSEESNIALLEKIVKDQREIIKEETGKPADQTPQLWALYKEVQEYYDRGMRVPDDVTLLLCDDNWGNIRKLPKLDEKPRKGGYGIYYHYDYVGGPRNYKWVNTNPITKVWEQMNMAYEYGANQIWIVNVGDIKPMEFPTEFFLDFAWNPRRWPAERLQEYTRLWAEKQFGAEHASEIADIISKYTKYNGRRKPELLSPETYSLTNYREFERIVFDYNSLLGEAEKINLALPVEFRDAYYQLVLHPVKACANLNELYYTVAKNRLYATQGRASTNRLAEKVKLLFDRDAAISEEYNKGIANGKWNHMMDQTHIGYTGWQQPERNTMPAVERIDLPATAELGVAIEGSDNFWLEGSTAVLEMSSLEQESRYFDVFNRGTGILIYSISCPVSWVKLSSNKGSVEEEQRVWLSVDWEAAPMGVSKVPVGIIAGDKTVFVEVLVVRSSLKAGYGFSDTQGYVAIEAEHFNRAVNKGKTSWKKIPDYGRTLSGMTTLPSTAAASKPGVDSPRLEYEVGFEKSGEVTVHTYISPSLDFTNSNGLRYAISIDDEVPQVINLHADNTEEAWNVSVADNIKVLKSKHLLKTAGRHVLKFWRVSPGVVLQKLVIDTGGLKESYLGPPETN